MVIDFLVTVVVIVGLVVGVVWFAYRLRENAATRAHDELATDELASELIRQDINGKEEK